MNITHPERVLYLGVSLGSVGVELLWGLLFCTDLLICEVSSRTQKLVPKACDELTRDQVLATLVVILQGL